MDKAGLVFTISTFIIMTMEFYTQLKWYEVKLFDIFRKK